VGSCTVPKVAPLLLYCNKNRMFSPEMLIMELLTVTGSDWILLWGKQERTLDHGIKTTWSKP